MAINTATSFTMTMNEIISAMFANLGVGSEGEALTARMYADGKRQLNLMVKTFGAMPHLWTKTEGTVTPVASQAAYTITPKPMRVLSVRRRLDDIDTPLNEMARETYFDQPNKTASASIPVSFYYDPQVDTGVLYLWPAPDANFVADQTLHITYMRRMGDLDLSTDNLDVPQEWLEAFIWNGSKRLMPQYPVNDRSIANDIKEMAGETYATLRAFDNEPASLFMQMDYQGFN